MLLEHAPRDSLQTDALKLFLGDGPTWVVGRPSHAAPSPDRGAAEPGPFGSVLVLAGSDDRTRIDGLGPMLSECMRRLRPDGRVAVLCNGSGHRQQRTARSLIARALGRGGERGHDGVGVAVVVTAMQEAGFQGLQIWDVRPSAEDPVEASPQPATVAADGGAATAAFLVTAAASAAAGPSILERAVYELAPAANGPRLSLRRVINSTRGKSVALLDGAPGGLVIRIARSAAMLEDETCSHGVLGDLAGKPAGLPQLPRPMGTVTLGGYSFFAQSGLPGVPLSTALNDGNRAHWAGEVGRFLLALHAASADEHAEPLDGERAKELFRPMIDFALDHVDDEALRSAVRRTIAGALAGAVARMGVVHGDFGPGNLLVADARLTGVIDWEAARGRGPVVVDAINYLESAHRRCHPATDMADTLLALVEERWPSRAEQDLLRAAFVASGTDPRCLRGMTLLYVLYHFGPQLRFFEADRKPAARLQATLKRLVPETGRG